MQVLRNESLQRWHTLASASIANELVVLRSLNDLHYIQADDIVFGAGSNIVFVNDIQVRLAHMAIKGIEVIETSAESTLIKAMAGENWHTFVAAMVTQGLGGLENLALIPGTVGAAPVQNIGAYGVEVSDCIHSVEVYDHQNGCLQTINKDDCGFAYRQSYFKTKWRERYVIVSVTFELSNHPQLNLSYAGLHDYSPPLTTIQDVFEAVVQIRNDKLPSPDKLPNAGSFFHNPIIDCQQFKSLKTQYSMLPCYKVDEYTIKIPAAWLIESCGFKGYREGGVGMYDKHALVLINYHGSGQDILQFSQHIIDTVRAKFGITLHIEPRIIGT